TKLCNLLKSIISISFFYFVGILSKWIKYMRHEKTPEEKLRDELYQSKTYQEWVGKVKELDILLNRVSPYYDYNLIQVRLDHLRESNDVLQMIYILRSDYTEEVVTQLEYIGENNFAELPNYSKIEFFHDTKQSFGNTALVLYGGATFVVKALNEKGLLPRIISGTTVGALIAALVCIRTDDELPSIFKEGGVDLGAFSKLGSKGNIRRKISRFLKHGHLMDIKVVVECVRSNVGDLTFEEAFARTKRILNITVSSTRKFEVPQLLNYLTAPNVLIWSAACASVAMMGLYDSVDLLAKDKNGNIVHWAPSEIKWKKWTDAVPTESESPLTRITELFNVNHFIVSQANPYIVPFLTREQTIKYSLLGKIGYFISTEFRHRLYQLEQMKLLPKMFREMVDEKVSGNVTIVPSISFDDFKKLFSNPSHSSLDSWILKGEQSTWPLLALIKNRCIIELALDRVYLKLKSAPSERNYSVYPNSNKKINRKRTKSATATPLKKKSKAFMSMLYRFREAQAVQLGLVKPKERRPYLASDCNNLKDAEKWRQQIIREISRKLMREKGHWEDQIKKLGGPDYRKVGPKMLDHEGKEVPGNRGYKYFGRAKDLPGVRELFEQDAPTPSKRTRFDLYKNVDADYYGYRDEEDETLLEYEREKEENLIKEILQNQGNTAQKNKDISSSVEGIMDVDDFSEKYVSHVAVPSQKDIEEYLVQRRKRQILDRYVPDNDIELSKTTLWLGSSIENSIGIDRNNNLDNIEIAYNDPKGVIKNFIINGLNHVNAILGQRNFIDINDFEYHESE
ncbi:22186_t:CDS:10, partial [Entrophospora sp. SA101]